jgi:hypothetical protein
MSNRAQRRSDQRLFRHGRHVETYLIAPSDDAAFKRKPLLARAADYWHGGLHKGHHWCIGCELPFDITGDVKPGLFLFAVPPGADVASISAICTTCQSRLDESQIEQLCIGVLDRLWPNGRFLDPRR